jgi:hypothetical protein
MPSASRLPAAIPSKRNLGLQQKEKKARVLVRVSTHNSLPAVEAPSFRNLPSLLMGCGRWLDTVEELGRRETTPPPPRQ